MGEGERINLGLNLKSLSFHCSAHFCLCYLIDFPEFVCVFGLKKCLLLHFCISGLPPPFHPWKSVWRVKTMVVAFKFCGQHIDHQLPNVALPKHRAGLVGLALKNNHTNVADMFHKLPKMQDKTKMACAIFRESVENKNLRMMKRTLLHKVYISVPISLVLHTLKKSFQWTSSLIPFSVSISAKCFTT